MSSPTDADCVIVGAGHNGLVAAFYLAKRGFRVVVVERRDIVGGACVTESFAPGYHASVGAYVLSMLRAPIWYDMKLAERGIRVSAAGPTRTMFDDGEALLLSADVDESARETARFSKHDARALPGFEERLAAMARALGPLFDWTPPNLAFSSSRDLRAAARLGWRGLRHRELAQELAFCMATSIGQYLGERFESEHVRGALGWHAINDSTAGPSTPGTAFVLLHDHVAAEAGGQLRDWGFVDGGMGQLTQAMAAAAHDAGAEMRLGAPVERILVDGDRVEGVALANGTTLRAGCVISNADPKQTFLKLLAPDELPTDFVAAVKGYRCEGTSMKINLALGELPRTAEHANRGVQDYHRGILQITPFLPKLDTDQEGARRGIPAEDPHIELCIPTVHDPSLAPAGRHVMTIDVMSQPYTLANGEWDDIKESVADRAIARIGEHFPNVPKAIIDRQVLSPLDLERVLGLSGGHALHGEMSPDQLFSQRPVRGFGTYRAPLRGLYLCGAGTHPGGGVSGANGRNCAREVIRDRARRVRRPARAGLAA